MSGLPELAWLGGLCEGEACFVSGISKSKAGSKGHASRYVRIAIEMCDLDTLMRAQHLFGSGALLRERTPPSLNPKHRRRYILTLHGERAVTWMLMLWPFLGERRRDAVAKALHIYSDYGQPYAIEEDSLAA